MTTEWPQHGLGRRGRQVTSNPTQNSRETTIPHSNRYPNPKVCLEYETHVFSSSFPLLRRLVRELSQLLSVIQSAHPPLGLRTVSADMVLERGRVEE